MPPNWCFNIYWIICVIQTKFEPFLSWCFTSSNKFWLNLTTINKLQDVLNIDKSYHCRNNGYDTSTEMLRWLFVYSFENPNSMNSIRKMLKHSFDNITEWNMKKKHNNVYNKCSRLLWLGTKRVIKSLMKLSKKKKWTLLFMHNEMTRRRRFYIIFKKNFKHI